MKDVITQLEPELFKKVTGLNVKDFELLVSLNVFNEALMNDAVYKFKRYEDASLSYTGIDRHAGESIGLYRHSADPAGLRHDGGQLVNSEEAPAPSAEDVPDAPYFGADTTTAEEDEDEVPEPEPKTPAKQACRTQPGGYYDHPAGYCATGASNLPPLVCPTCASRSRTAQGCAASGCL